MSCLVATDAADVDDVAVADAAHLTHLYSRHSGSTPADAPNNGAFVARSLGAC